jgi:hypothetical protein
LETINYRENSPTAPGDISLHKAAPDSPVNSRKNLANHRSLIRNRLSSVVLSRGIIDVWRFEQD